ANGSLVVRVLALGLMQGDTSLADVDTILSAINDGRSRNEQFQAMVLAQKCWTKLSPAEQSDIRWAIGRAKFEPGGDRYRKAQELLGPGLPDPVLPGAGTRSADAASQRGRVDFDGERLSDAAASSGGKSGA